MKTPTASGSDPIKPTPSYWAQANDSIKDGAYAPQTIKKMQSSPTGQKLAERKEDTG